MRIASPDVIHFKRLGVRSYSTAGGVKLSVVDMGVDGSLQANECPKRHMTDGRSGYEWHVAYPFSSEAVDAPASSPVSIQPFPSRLCSPMAVSNNPG